LICALLLTEALLPLFNYLLDKNLTPGKSRNPALLGTLAGIPAFVGVVAGCYPALLLSSFRPVEVLKGPPRSSLLAALFRRGLVVVQFCIAIVLIIGSVTMAAQMAYFAEKDLGFDHEQVVVVPMQDEVIGRYETLKNAVRQHPGVVQVAAASNTPGQNSYSFTSYIPGGAPNADGIGIRTIFIDYEFAETFGLAFTAGRNFSPEFPADSSESLILNEAALKLLGWTEDPLGRTLTYDDRTATVVGVLRDFHFSTLQEEIPPIVFRLQPNVFRYLAVRIRAENTTATLDALEDTWRAFAPAYPFEYAFVDDDYAEEYTGLQRLSETIRAFAFLAILVACLGLFGLVAYTTEQRTKEIGVRKVLGASVASILVLLSRDFLKLVAVALVVAWPLAYAGLSRWLDDFAYRIELGWPVFALAGGVALAVALLTMAYQSLRAALANPVQSLRHE
jgi:putative ABC transport system permease protein